MTRRVQEAKREGVGSSIVDGNFRGVEPIGGQYLGREIRSGIRGVASCLTNKEEVERFFQVFQAHPLP